MNNNKAGILTLCKTSAEETPSALIALSEAVSKYFEVETKEFTSIKPLFAQLGAQLTENNLVIIAAEPALFYSAKETFCQALSLKCENSEEVIASLPTSYFPKTEREYRVVAGFPRKSEILFTTNGLFSGFCSKAGEQKIIFLPLEDKLIRAMLAGDLGEMLEKISDENTIVETDILAEQEPEKEPEQEAAPKAQAEEEAPAQEEQEEPKTIIAGPAGAPVAPPVAPVAESTAPAGIPISQSAAAQQPRTGSSLLQENFANMVNALKNAGASLSFALSGPYKYIINLIESVPESKSVVCLDTAPAPKWSSGQFNDYFASLAKTTFENCGTDLAGAVSTLYTDATGKFMFFVVADAAGAKITKVSGKEANEIVFKCMTGLVKAITDKANLRAAEMPAQEKKNEVVKSHAPLAIAAVMLVMAIIASTFISVYFGGKKEEAPTEPASVEQITETQPTTTAPVTTEPETTTGAEGESETQAEQEESTSDNAVG